MVRIDQTSFFIQSHGKGKFVKIIKDDILYIESAQNYLQIHICGYSYVTYLTIAEVVAVLPEEQFIRVHKSFLVNLKHVNSIDGTSLYLSNTTKIALGRNYKKGFFDHVNAMLLKSKRYAVAK